jgi:aminopeptidase N
VEDRTVLAVNLPQAVAPGATVAVEVAWTAHVPRTFRRTGVIDNYYFLAQWFPKLGVLEDAGWNTHQFHMTTEFFSDYGVYDARLTVPRGWVVGATGVERSTTDTPGGKTVHQFVQEDVHDFAWTTGPDLLVKTERFEHPRLPAVDLRLILQPEHAGQAERYFLATKATLRSYGEWFGPYPYGHLTIVDPAWQSAAGGMEYPTLFTGGSRWLAPATTVTPEGITVDECGHQFWYGLVGNNEFEHAWMDEGLNTYSSGRAIDESFSPNFQSTEFFGGFIPWVFHDVPAVREIDGDHLSGYRAAARSDVPSTPSWRYNPATGRAMTYNKTALWLHTLERYLGWRRLQRGMSLFFARSVFKHPQPEDFFAAINEGAGRDMTWYFDQVYRSSNVFDYAIGGLTSRMDGKTAHTEVTVQRLGEAVFPVDVEVTFADGTRAREHWDGRDRWKLYSWDRPSAALSAEVDPDHVLLLDINRTNNSLTLAPQAPKAARQWAGRWLVWFQDLVMTYAFYV